MSEDYIGEWALEGLIREDRDRIDRVCKKSKGNKMTVKEKDILYENIWKTLRNWLDWESNYAESVSCIKVLNKMRELEENKNDCI